MAYIERDESGNITAITDTPSGDTPETVDPTSPEVKAFLHEGDVPEDSQKDWLAADLSLARVIEDLVDILIKKKLIEITDFPISAQQKLISRRGKRNDYGYLTELFPADDEDEELVI